MEREKESDQPEPGAELSRQTGKVTDWTRQEWFVTWLRLARHKDQKSEEPRNN
jgi:hypothetical protein